MRKLFPIPTGYLFVDDYSKGQLETLSIGDYGKGRNVKADFLGYTDIIQGVPNGYCMPLSDKWVVTLSTQFGCPMKCTFCDVPNVPFKGNASLKDLYDQLFSAIKLFPDVGYTERLNIHFARMGEPIYNDNVFTFSTLIRDLKERLQSTYNLRTEVIHPVLTTSLPKNFKDLESQLHRWADIKNTILMGQAGLQFSINSTNEKQRDEMFRGMQLDLESFAKIADKLPMPLGRKYCLNFAYSTDFEINAAKLGDLFDKEKFMCKITPIHNNSACRENNIKTIGGYDSWQPYSEPEKALIKEGFDVLVFVPSMDEEDGLVTCGNAVLGSSKFGLKDNVIKIKGLYEKGNIV